VCAEWKDFAVFLAHVGPRPSAKHSLDRIDNARGYEPGNVRWATLSEQARNRRPNIWIEYQGKRMVLSDWAASLGLNQSRTFARFYRGITDPERLFAPERIPAVGKKHSESTRARMSASQATRRSQERTTRPQNGEQQ
jgi:hypothetical protein